MSCGVLIEFANKHQRHLFFDSVNEYIQLLQILKVILEQLND